MQRFNLFVPYNLCVHLASDCRVEGWEWTAAIISIDISFAFISADLLSACTTVGNTVGT